MTLRQTHTYALLEISAAAYDEIKKKLLDVHYDHVFGSDGEMDMHGIALVKEETTLTSERVVPELACTRCGAPYLATGQCSRFAEGCQGGWGERNAPALGR